METKQLAIVAAAAALAGSLGVVLFTRLGSEEPAARRTPKSAAARSKPVASDAATVDVSAKLESAARNANEAAALATLRALNSAQALASATALIDLDRDGLGEYAFMGELAASAPLRGGTALIEPSLMPIEFGEISPYGVATRSGYHYRIFLPGAPAGRSTPGLHERSTTRPDPDESEVLWCAYAWPVAAGKSGVRAFFTNQDGDLFEAANTEKPYSGEQHAPEFDAAFDDKHPQDMGAALPTAPRGHKGNDGRVWKLVGQ